MPANERFIAVAGRMLKVMAATAVVAQVHSALASRPAKKFAARQLGKRNRNGLYRIFDLAQSAVNVALLFEYIREQPSKERVRGPAALLMHVAQAGALVYATSAAKQVGIRHILGVDSLLAWLGTGPVTKEPEAQGPALDKQARRHAVRPFAHSRHHQSLGIQPCRYDLPDHRLHSRREPSAR